MLNDAAAWLREALERDATMLIARLHLGRVETLRANEKDGLVHLERVLSATTDPATAYLAALFSGAAHERLRRPEAAEASYRQAIERFPAGQAAYVALSELLQRSGKADESRAVLHSLLDAKARLRPRAVVVVPGRAAGRRRRAARRVASRGAALKAIIAAAALAIAGGRPRRSSAFAAAWTPCAWTCSSPTATARSAG